jgi:hypothetical protein
MGRKVGPDAVNNISITNDLSVGTALDESTACAKACSTRHRTTVSFRITENGGSTWRAVGRFPGRSRIHFVSGARVATRHEPVYAAFNNMLRGDFSAISAEERGSRAARGRPFAELPRSRSGVDDRREIT